MRRKALLAMLAGLAGALRRCSLRLTNTRLRAASSADESKRLWSATDVLQFAKSPFAAWMDRRYASATGDDRAGPWFEEAPLGGEGLPRTLRDRRAWRRATSPHRASPARATRTLYSLSPRPRPFFGFLA